MSGVRTLAGYVDTAKHGRVRFVIALKGNTGTLRYRLMQEIERGL
jgi:D-alanyl-D-alanine carboxypeptidase/D-alanyl-D-alanine-endopeptidase (penicillin-binding protein 4)